MGAQQLRMHRLLESGQGLCRHLPQHRCHHPHALQCRHSHSHPRPCAGKARQLLEQAPLYSAAPRQSTPAPVFWCDGRGVSCHTARPTSTKSSGQTRQHEYCAVCQWNRRFPIPACSSTCSRRLQFKRQRQRAISGMLAGPTWPSSPRRSTTPTRRMYSTHACGCGISPEAMPDPRSAPSPEGAAADAETLSRQSSLALDK